jgi:hypothetical protein
MKANVVTAASATLPRFFIGRPYSGLTPLYVQALARMSQLGATRERPIYARAVSSIPKHGRFALRSPICVLFVTALVGMLVAACGSTYTRADFIRRADGICLSTTRALRSLTPPQFTGSAVQQQLSLSRYLARVSPLVSAESRRLAGLPKPPGRPADAALLQRWLRAVHDSASDIHVLGDSERAGDPAFIAAARTALGALPVVKLASRYGMKACAGPGASYSFPAVR